MLPPIHRKALMKTYKNTTDSVIEVFTTGRQFQRIAPRGKHSFADGEDGNCGALVAKGILRLIPEESPPDYLDIVMASLRKELEAFLPKICDAVRQTLRGENADSLNGTLAELGNKIYSYVGESETEEMIKEVPVIVTPIDEVILPESDSTIASAWDENVVETETVLTTSFMNEESTSSSSLSDENPVISTEETSGKRGKRKHR